jgi:hypothetical protein
MGDDRGGWHEGALDRVAVEQRSIVAARLGRDLIVDERRWKRILSAVQEDGAVGEPDQVSAFVVPVVDGPVAPGHRRQRVI